MRPLLRIPTLLTAALLSLPQVGCAAPLLEQTGQQLPSIRTEAAVITPEVIASGLEHPWSVAFLPDGKMLVTERVGNLKVISPLGAGRYQVSRPVTGLPDIWVGGQGGLLDVAWHEGWVYFSYAEAGSIPFSNSTAVMRARLNQTGNQYRLSDQQRLFSQSPKYVSRGHFGSRLAFDRQGHLYITLGERYLPRDDAQTLDNHHGKIIRINLDGSIPRDNPFVNRPQAKPEIWSLGHRNLQGAAIHPETGALWTHEHGPRGGDELNRIEAGHNYGWPVITYGEEYAGGKIGEGTAKAGMEQPRYYWVPSIAPSGMAFNTSPHYPAWQGDLLVGSLKFRQLVRLTMEGGKVVQEERISLPSVGQRIRDVRVGLDQLIYLLTDDADGKLIRLLPTESERTSQAGGGSAG